MEVCNMKKRIMIALTLTVILCAGLITYIKFSKESSLANENTGIESQNNQNIQQEEKEPEILVKYDGPVHHVFFHSLIAYTDLAFDNDSRANGYNYWMTTVSEFKKMLPELLERGYMLYDIEELIEEDPVDSSKIRKKAFSIIRR